MPSTPPASTAPPRPEAASPTHDRVLQVVDRLSQDGLRRVFGELPGADRLGGYLQRRAHRELVKLDESTLQGYLDVMAALIVAVRSGEGFEAMIAASDKIKDETEAA